MALNEIKGMGDDYRMALYQVIPEDQRANYSPLGDGLDRVDIMNFVMTAGLTLMGLCLLTGFCTRLAAIGAVVFLANVVLTQLPWPTIYPPMPPVTGHSMLVDKKLCRDDRRVGPSFAYLAGRWGRVGLFPISLDRSSDT